MVHQRQGLTFGLEASDHLPCVHPGLDYFQRHATADRPLLLGHKHDAKAALADLLQQLVGADLTAGTFGERPFARRVGRRRRALKKVARVVLGCEHPLNPAAEAFVHRTGVVQERAAVGARLLFQRGEENRFEG